MSKPADTRVGATLLDAALDVVWRQWAVLGGSVAGVSRDARAVIDPEALVLMSLVLAEDERRLDDVTASWITLNSTLLSVQRLKNLLPDFPPDTARRLSGLAAVAMHAGDARWKSIATTPGETIGRGNKLRATRVHFQQPTTLMLQLRTGMGVGVKADVLAYLLASWDHSRPWASTATIVGATGYTAAAVRRAADDLAAARFIDKPVTGEAELTGQRLYAAEPERWVRALGMGNIEPGWRNWRERFVLVCAVRETNRRLAQHPFSDYALGVALRALLEKHRASFTRDRVVTPQQLEDADDWPATFAQATDLLAGWMRHNA